MRFALRRYAASARVEVSVARPHRPAVAARLVVVGRRVGLLLVGSGDGSGVGRLIGSGVGSGDGSAIGSGDGSGVGSAVGSDGGSGVGAAVRRLVGARAPAGRRAGSGSATRGGVHRVCRRGRREAVGSSALCSGIKKRGMLLYMKRGKISRCRGTKLTNPRPGPRRHQRRHH